MISSVADSLMESQPLANENGYRSLSIPPQHQLQSSNQNYGGVATPNTSSQEESKKTPDADMYDNHRTRILDPTEHI